MARASTPTLLPLDRWFALMGMSPLHGNQVGADAHPEAACGHIIYQYDWQNADAVGRESIASAIRQAEDIIHDLVGYRLLPAWEVDEFERTTRPARRELYNVGNQNVRNQLQSVHTKSGHVISGGIQAKVAIAQTSPITYSDNDGDGYPERAQISVTTTVTDPDEIAVYFPGEAGADEWEIRPITVSISGGTATIRFRREQAADPDLWERLDASEIDGDVNANFLTTVDVYRRYNDPQQQVQLMWEPLPESFCGCGSGSCVMCAWSTQFGCMMARDNRLGIFTYTPGTWNSDDEGFDEEDLAVARQPDKVRIWYYAGWRDQRKTRPLVEMDQYWETAVAYLAASLLDRDICSCDNVRAFVGKWREDLSLQLFGPGGRSYNIGDRSIQRGNKVLDNPIGTTRGALYAWQKIQSRMLGQGI